MATDRDIRRKLLNIKDLPTLPAVVHQILGVVEDEGTSSQDLASVLECDHAISARVLRLANSAFYGLPAQVISIQRAIVLIGFDTVKMLALATSVFSALAGRRQSALDPEDFWMHSLGAAKAAHMLARKQGAADSTDICFTGGLLHDMGKFLLSLGMGEEYAVVCQEAVVTDRPLREVELKRLGGTHAEVGSWVAQRWRFPAAIATVIAKQHYVSSYNGPHAREAGIVAFSDAISRMAGFGLACDPKVQSLPAAPAAGPPLSKQELGKIVADLRNIRSETRDLLNLMSQS